MALEHMQVFNEYIMPATIETLCQDIDKFNANSGGAIQLSTDGFVGSFMERSFWAGVHASQRRVNRYAPNTDVAKTDLTQLRENCVKVAGGIGPVMFEPSQLTWLQKPTAEAIEVASRNFSEIMMADQLNTAIAALVAAIGNQAEARFDAATPVDYLAMNSGHALFGDSSSSIIASVMSGSMYHKLMAKNIMNAERLFMAGSVQVVDILGKMVIVTDAPALFDGTNDYVLGLTSGAAIVFDGSDVISNIDTQNCKERIETTLQVDYSFGLCLKGYSWDKTNGGESPDDATLATGANWTKSMTCIKHTAGVLTAGPA